MKELEKTLARLRMLQSEIKARENQLHSLRQLLQGRLSRIPNYTLYGTSDLDSSVSMMEDIAQRMAKLEATLSHLEAIKKRAQEEVESLELVKKVEETKAELLSLQARSQRDEDTEKEIRRLQRLIDEASEKAARSISLK